MADYQLIVNPTAGGGRGKQFINKIEKICAERKSEFRIATTEKSGDAIHLARKFAKSECDVVVAVGGDGTINEVANGLVGGDKIFGIIPVGTGNDFVNMLNIPGDVYRAIEILEAAQTAEIDVGKIGDRYFLNGVGIGFNGKVAYEASQTKKKVRGIGAYLTIVMKCVFTYQSPRMEIYFGEEFIERKVFMISVMNGRREGGGFRVAPHAKIDDGFLDILLVEDLSVVEVFRFLPKAISGKFSSVKKMRQYLTKKVLVKTEYPVIAHADGEVINKNGTHFEIEILPGALQVIGDFGN